MIDSSQQVESDKTKNWLHARKRVLA